MKRRTQTIVTALGLLTVAGSVYPANPTPFASATAPNGVGVSNGKLLITHNCTENVDQVDSSGNVTLFANLPSPSPTPFCGEKEIAVAPPASASATPAWTPGTIFVIRGKQIFRVSAGSATLFTTVTDCTDDESGITFDQVGTFGNNMIVTCQGGKVEKVLSNGTVGLIADTAAFTRGPAVAPTTFGTYAGQILVADNDNSWVTAIDNVGTITTEIVDWAGPEQLSVIPNPILPFYIAVVDLDKIYKFPSTDFTGLEGDVLVTSEIGIGTGRIHWNGGGYDILAFDNLLLNVLESGASAALSTPTPTSTPTSTPTATATATPTATATATATPTVTVTPAAREISYSEID
jgi:hypothetical protein